MSKQNALKEQIRGALELGGYRLSTQNIELVYQVYSGDIGKAIREVKSILRK